MSPLVRVVVALVLAVLALAVGIAAWSTPHVTGGTVLAFILAMTGLHVIAPLCDDEDPSIEVRRITLDELEHADRTAEYFRTGRASRAAARRRCYGVKLTREGRIVVIHEGVDREPERHRPGAPHGPRRLRLRGRVTS